MTRPALSRGSIQYLGAATEAAAVTAHDTNPIDATRAIMVNVAGDVAVRFADASADVTLTLLAGVYYPFCLVAVRATGTTATGISAFY